jgi:ABC-2 type transport system permease protein
VLNAFVQMGLVVLLGHVLYGVHWPQDWLLLAGFTALGVVCFGALGIAFAHAIPNFDAAPAYVNAVFLPAIFISGVFYSSDTLPAALAAIAQALPLKHLIDGLSQAIVGGHHHTLVAAAAVAGWAAAGLVLAVRYFRWE